MIFLKPWKIDYMGVAEKTVAKTPVKVKKAVKPGVSTLALDKIAERYIRSSSAVPGIKGYSGFLGAASLSLKKEAAFGRSSLKMLKNGYHISIVRDYVGHGIGRRMYEDPQIPNYGSAGRGPRLRSGMTLAIESIINPGTHAGYFSKMLGGNFCASR